MQTVNQFIERLGLAPKPFPSHISVSQINTFNQCRMQWLLKYGTTAIAHYPSRVLVGSLVHKGLEVANNLKYHGEPISSVNRSIITDSIDDAIAKVDEDLYVWEDNPVNTYKRVHKVAQNCVEVVNQLARPMLVEHSISGLNLGKTPIEGYIDVMGEDGFIRDFKVGARHKSQADCDKDIQLSLYSWAMSTPNVSFVSISSATGDFKIFESIRSQEMIDTHMEVMELTADAIDGASNGMCVIPGEGLALPLDNFAPNLDSKYGCGGCAFNYVCPFGGKCSDGD